MNENTLFEMLVKAASPEMAAWLRANRQSVLPMLDEFLQVTWAHTQVGQTWSYGDVDAEIVSVRKRVGRPTNKRDSELMDFVVKRSDQSAFVFIPIYDLDDELYRAKQARETWERLRPMREQREDEERQAQYVSDKAKAARKARRGLLPKASGNALATFSIKYITRTGSLHDPVDTWEHWWKTGLDQTYDKPHERAKIVGDAPGWASGMTLVADARDKGQIERFNVQQRQGYLAVTLME